MAKAKKQKENFFVRFWSGQLSLPMSYWGVGIGIGILFSILVVIIVLGLGMHDDAMWGFIIPFQIFTVVGIWRSADRYKGPKFWAILAKIAIVIGIISNFASLLMGY
tara:strand:+ start:923 stop:1243 length:321 start_codon:yes stop_codon:yes gene_type:complete